MTISEDGQKNEQNDPRQSISGKLRKSKEDLEKEKLNLEIVDLYKQWRKNIAAWTPIVSTIAALIAFLGTFWWQHKQLEQSATQIENQHKQSMEQLRLAETQI